MTVLLSTQYDHYVHLTLHRPEAKNALNTELLAELAAQFEALSETPQCRAILLSGADGNFAAGADIGEIEHKTAEEGAKDPRKDYWARIAACPKPVIAAVDGFCLGGGFELALIADGIVAGATARFGLPETSLGLIPGAGGGQRLLARIGRARASRMILFGEIIDAETAEAWGIAAWRGTGNAVETAEPLVAKLSRRAPLALSAAKRALISGDETGRAFALERSSFEALLDTEDKREGILSFREKRKPEFKGK